MTAYLTAAPELSRIARENIERALVCEEELTVLRTRLNGLTGLERSAFEALQVSPLDGKQDSHCLITIVFAALAVEACIYEYASRNLGDEFAREHMDRLDSISRLVVTARLVTGKDFPKGGRAYQLVRQLIKHRNYVVHSKSVPLLNSAESPSGIPGPAKGYLEFRHSLFKNAKEAIQALHELSEVMQELDPDEQRSVVFRGLTGKHKTLPEQDNHPSPRSRRKLGPSQAG